MTPLGRSAEPRLALAARRLRGYNPAYGKWGITMLRHRLAFGLLAAGILLSSGASAWAFSQQSVGPGDNGNSAFTDPDDQITNNFAQGVRPLDSNERSMQLGVQQQGTFDPLWWEQSLHGYGPYYQTRRSGN